MNVCPPECRLAAGLIKDALTYLLANQVVEYSCFRSADCTGDWASGQQRTDWHHISWSLPIHTQLYTTFRR